MKKALLIMALLMICTSFVFADDVITYQVRFKKLIFKCQDGTEEIVDASTFIGEKTKYVCKDEKPIESVINYSGLIRLSADEYETTDSQEMKVLKDAKVAKYIYAIENAPIEGVTSLEDYEKKIYITLARLDDLVQNLKEKESTKLTKMKENIDVILKDIE